MVRLSRWSFLHHFFMRKNFWVDILKKDDHEYQSLLKSYIHICLFKVLPMLANKDQEWGLPRTAASLLLRWCRKTKMLIVWCVLSYTSNSKLPHPELGSLCVIAALLAALCCHGDVEIVYPAQASEMDNSIQIRFFHCISHFFHFCGMLFSLGFFLLFKLNSCCCLTWETLEDSVISGELKVLGCM